MDKKALNLPILISLVVGNMIGTGIYVLPAALAQFGTISILSWIYTAMGAILLALTLVRLNKRFPKTGGPYVYCKQAYGRLVGFLIAYLYWVGNLVSIAGITVASLGYLGFLVPSLNANSPAYSHFTALGLEIIILWLFTLINIIGIHTAGVVQLFLTVIKILPLVFVTLLGLGSIHLNNLMQFNVSHVSNFSAFSSAAALTFWAFIGLEAATIPAENTEGSKVISKATIFGTSFTSLIYIASTFVLMGMIPINELQVSQFPFAEAGMSLFGHHAAQIIALCAFVSGIGALNVCVLIQGQIVFAAARDHLFPRMFAKLSKHDVPVAGQLLSSSIITVFLIFTMEPTLLKQFDNIALLATLLTLLTYFGTALSEIKFLAQDHGSLGKAFLHKSMIVPLLASIYSVWMVSGFSGMIVEWAVVAIALCIPIYYFVIRKYVAN